MVERSRRQQIVQAARALLEQGGASAVTMRAVADRLGIRAPSLYKHFPDKEALEMAVISTGFAEQAEAFAALEGAEDPLTALVRAYRAWALEHPHLYRLMTARPFRRDLVGENDQRAVALMLKVFGGDQDRARAVWAFAHGMVSLELADRFPGADLSAAWDVGLAALRSPDRTGHEGHPAG